MPSKLRALSLLHRSLGLFAAGFIIITATTGLLLNHTDDLQLAQHRLHAPWLLDRYGIAPPELSVAFAVGDRWVSQWGSQVLLNDQPLAMPPASRLLGAWGNGELLVTATTERVDLYTTDGQPVDTLAYPGGERARLAGILGTHFAVVLESGASYTADARFTALTPAPDSSLTVEPFRPLELSEPVREQIQTHFTGESIHLERLILDLHSGRLFGQAGVYLFDAVAIVALLLAPSGLAITWLRQRRRSARIR